MGDEWEQSGEDEDAETGEGENSEEFSICHVVARHGGNSPAAAPAYKGFGAGGGCEIAQRRP